MNQHGPKCPCGDKWSVVNVGWCQCGSTPRPSPVSAMFATKSPHYVAELNNPDHPWRRNEFAYLGKVTHSEGWSIGWAWHADGRSIDRDDRAFDLIDFPPPAPSYHFWLGADA